MAVRHNTNKISAAEMISIRDYFMFRTRKALMENFNLSDRDYEIIELRLARRKTLEEIALQYELSGERVRQICNGVMQQIKGSIIY